MEKINEVIHIIAFVMDIVAVLIMTWGVGISVFKFIKSWLKKPAALIMRERLYSIRLELGGYILYGLEILIVVDVIETIISPTMTALISLVIIVAIRTIVLFTLNLELKEIEAHKKERKNEHKKVDFV